MAKELPYFRFTAQEWQNGDISLESYEYKGLFIDICSYYWVKDCSITLAMLEKKFSNAKDMVEQLIELEILQMYDTENINIDFLDEQFDLLSEKRKKRSDAGRRGGLKKSSNAKAMLKQKPSYKDKDKEKDNTTKSYDYAEESKIFNSISNLFDSKYYNTDAKKTKWLDVIRLLHTADGYSYSLIESVIAYAKADDFWSANVLSISSLRKKTNDVSKFDNIKAKFDGSGTVQRKQLNAKLKYATPKEMLPHFDNEQAMNDSLQNNTYVSNGEKIFPLRYKNGDRSKEGDYILGTDKQLHKITI